MEITVKNLYKRISPRKVRPSLFGLRGMNAQKAQDMLRFGQKKADGFIYELVKAGIASVKESGLDTEKAIIKSICCNEGPRLKRHIPWSKGQSRRITKRLCHITMTVSVDESVSTIKKTTEKKAENNTSEAK